MSEPTPRPCPWCGEVPRVITALGSSVECYTERCLVSGPERPTAAEAIAAWNSVAAKCRSHDALVAALEELEREAVEGLKGNMTPRFPRMRDIARAALALAQGGLR